MKFLKLTANFSKMKFLGGRKYCENIVNVYRIDKEISMLYCIIKILKGSISKGHTLWCAIGVGTSRSPGEL